MLRQSRPAFTTAAIGADLVAHGDDVGVVTRRPTKAERVHFAEECVIGGIRDRNCGARNQGSADHHGIDSLANQQRGGI